MKDQKKSQNLPQPEPETLTFHRQMYDRRIRKLRQRGGLSDREIAVQVNDPTHFRRSPQDAEADNNEVVEEVLDCPV
jgi:ribosome-binding protein aMBF1 (putative translation factor)